MNGDYVIGSSGLAQFPNLATAFNMLIECGMTGRVRFLLENGTYVGNINLSSISNVVKAGDIFELTSVSGNAQDVIIQSPVVGITLTNNRNIVIKNLTIDVTTGTYGIQFTSACSNILIRDCRILASPTTTSSAAAPIHKASGTGIADSIFIINNLLNGGYYGCYFYGGTGTTAYGTNLVFDSNTVSNQYYYGTYLYYADFISRSHNVFLSRETNTTTYWYGLHSYYTNGDIIGNRVVQRSSAITYSYGLYIYCYHYVPSPNPDTGKIINNEIIIGGNNYGIILYNAQAKVLHNSIYVSGTGAARGIYLQNLLADWVMVKNNNIVMQGLDAYPIYLSGTTNILRYDIDYNNMYASRYVGYAGASAATISAWQQFVPTDRHSVRVSPSFIDPDTSLQLSTYNGLLYPSHPDVTNDINEAVRPPMTAMGAYTNTPAQQDLMLTEITPWEEEIVEDQTLSINVDVINMGNLPITTAVLGWSVNDDIQSPSITWNPSPAVLSYEQRNISMGTFKANGADTFNIKVWVESVNGQEDTVKWNDTISTTAYMRPLAEFVAPFVQDTVFSLSFTVNALIRTGTGAPVSTPEMIIQSVVGNGSAILYNKVTMTQGNNGIWQARIPKQYYGTTLIYSLTVPDTEGNSITITDSTYIQYVVSTGDSIQVVGTGTNTATYSPYYSGYDRGWSRTIYMGWELHPQGKGGYISSIAYFNTSTTPSIVDSLSMYFRAVSDSVITTGVYQDPITDEATLVWGESTNISYNGWNVFSFDKPFYLPPGYNLMVYWNNRDGSSGGNGTIPYWQYTIANNKNIRSYANGTTFPTTANITIDGNRPNARFVFTASKEQYAGYDLGLLAITEPVTVSATSACSEDNVPLKVALANLGENDYNFSVDEVTLFVEVSGAISYNRSITLATGNLLSGAVDTIEITSMFPVYTPGQYNIKVWLESPIDNIIYDDTVFKTYRSARLGLPIDVDFSGTFPNEFVARGVNSPYSWEIISQGIGRDTAVVPSFGTGMLSFSGTKGAAVQLSTRQIELRGTISPTLQFWYFHDTLASEDYMDVRITMDGGANYITLYSLTKYDTAVGYGWRQYTTDLTPYVNAQCLNILFEAMITSTGVTQYLDRIFITAKQEIAVTEILTSELSACDLDNKDVKVVISNMSDPALDYNTTLTALVLEIKETGQTFNHTLTNDILGSFASDTVTVATGFNFTKGTYTMKAYFLSPLDDNSANDTLVTSIVINPALSVQVERISGGSINCLAGEAEIWQDITITNTGNLNLFNLGLILQIDTGETGSLAYAIIRETYPDTILVGDNITYRFKTSYYAPWHRDYYAGITAYLLCDSSLINGRDETVECVDTKDLHIVSIDNPNATKDNIGSAIQVTATLNNRSDGDIFNDVEISFEVKNSQGILITNFKETETVGILATVNHTFTNTYTVPNDSVYYLTVYTNKYDNYPVNDTMTIRRETDFVGIETLGENGFALGQNVPNPVANSTRIDYSIPESGEVVFHVHSISGQLLYSTTIEAASGKQSLEVNTSTFAAGIYFYSIEYKGQRLVKRMSVQK
jgi:hypothetical protein